MFSHRSAGILLHPTSLPSPGGIGDLGAEAYAFADFLFQGKQGLWQILPLSPPGLGNSPYSAISAFAGNPLLVSLARLAERGWITPDRLKKLPGRSSPIHFDEVKAAKLPLLREAAQNFLEAGLGPVTPVTPAQAAVMPQNPAQAFEHLAATEANDHDVAFLGKLSHGTAKNASVPRSFLVQALPERG